MGATDVALIFIQQRGVNGTQRADALCPGLAFRYTQVTPSRELNAVVHNYRIVTPCLEVNIGNQEAEDNLVIDQTSERRQLSQNFRLAHLARLLLPL